MSTYTRQPGDLAIQVYVPAEVGLEIGKLRLVSRKTNNAIVTELLREALQARGLLAAPSTPAPQPEVKPSRPSKSGKPTKAKLPPKLAQLAKIKPVTLADLQARERERQLTLPEPVAAAPSEAPTQPDGLAAPMSVSPPVDPYENDPDCKIPAHPEEIDFAALADNNPPAPPITDPFFSV